LAITSATAKNKPATIVHLIALPSVANSMGGNPAGRGLILATMRAILRTLFNGFRLPKGTTASRLPVATGRIGGCAALHRAPAEGLTKITWTELFVLPAPDAIPAISLKKNQKKTAGWRIGTGGTSPQPAELFLPS
jgi:hypothetical protein